ncbi:PREDICTED: zinc transporter ZIP11-like [Gekko japonicus]|uniref:Zinc transporter ZIP11 n=1 Tax=Gekko japonicus TaxID=146911 RepID=A0ABM1KVT8_GEKJA|nr:PREDICTED: zinc transporter ZIP11-like [Gekko japonicus]
MSKPPALKARSSTSTPMKKPKATSETHAPPPIPTIQLLDSPIYQLECPYFDIETVELLSRPLGAKRSPSPSPSSTSMVPETDYLQSFSFYSHRNLAIGIGIQNFPEGLAVSLPLRGAGFSTWRAFWYGQLSGMVEPLAGIFGAVAMVVAEPLLPYALAFAAGAMVYVVVDDIIPEAQISGNGKLASWTSILGFVVMMSLDVGLG